MSVLKSIWHFFIPSERTLILATFDQGQYFRVKQKLAAAGIPHRSRIGGGSRGTTHRAHYGGKTAVQHEIFVSRENEHRALEALR
ncbi:hypothetical protein [Paenibacillus sp. NFR01]|uniref:hypothetical protein n=1 Tax=Paenibacillus sp. NFR01 TaxID=1566279 RepID=UPI0008C74BDE|nr:hypothetical protein [Paenibacillus sp. NFR01]SET56700.1 hypothetical protein SAMN03159358_2042 [Paenibacillus sp. NFR01]